MEQINNAINKFAEKYKFKVMKDLGKGGYGYVKQIIIENQKRAGKLIERKNGRPNETDFILDFKGPNIVKVNKIYQEKINNKNYDFIVMEEADLKDLDSYIKKKLFNNKLNLIYMSPNKEVIGDNLLRFFANQMLKGFEKLDRNDYTHFDIKPNNFLIFKNMVIKLADFGLLRSSKVEEKEQVKDEIPGGTRGYLTPEFYENEERKILKENMKKQDYFALGATLFFTKYGENMLDYHEYKNDHLMTFDYIIDLLQKAMDHIKSSITSDNDFINFLCNLIQYKPEERYNFEQIYRNKWINKNVEEIKEILDINQLDEDKLLIELNKSDYLIDKKNYLENYDKIKDINNDSKIIDNDHSINKKNEFINRKNKFSFNRNKIRKKK